MAVTLTLNELAVQIGYSISDSVPPRQPYVVDLRDWLASATEMVERRAPNAPADTQNAAVTRLVGYWKEAPLAPPQRFGFNAFLHSGAAQLLGPWIARRAQAI